MDKKYTFRYATLQVAYWIGAIASLTFAERFLLSRGFTEDIIGVLLAIGFVLSLVVEPLTSSLADREDGVSLRTQIAVGNGLIVLLCAGLLLWKGRLVTAILFVLMSVLCTSLLPLVNAVSFFYMNKGIRADFSFGRGIGSAAFVISVYLGGILCERMPQGAIAILLGAALMGLGCALLFAPAEKGCAKKQQAKGPGLLGILRKYPDLVPLLAANTCLMACHNFLNTYMLNILAPTGYGTEMVGTLAAIGALVEIPVMLLFSQVTRRIRMEVLLVFAAIMFTVKAALSLLPTLAGTGIWVMYVASAMQMLAFAVFLPSSTVYLGSVVRAEDLARGQMLLTETQVLGTVACTLLGGIGISRFGTGITGICFTAVSALGIAFTLVAVSRARRASR